MDTDRAAKFVAQRAACYQRANGYRDIQIRSNNLTVLDACYQAFGGGLYHQSRDVWIWRTGKREELTRIADAVLPYWIPDENPALLPLFELTSTEGDALVGNGA